MDDPFGNMREQMERERDNFFKTVNPRDWPSDSSMRGGMFNRPRTSFGGFPSSGPDVAGHHSLPRTRRDPVVEGGSGSDPSDPDLSIPIRVIHEKPRPRYGQAQHSNTTELPAKAAAGTESPRLERAHSEPPGKFKQRLNISNPSAYTTIPEYGEGEPGRAQARSRPSNFNINLEPSNPIKTSASAPSVPGSGQSQSQAESQPAAPPRRSPPRAGAMAGQGAAGGNVRHIPIFVEGRQEPIFNQNQSGQQPGELPFSKPSDYYPPGVQRVQGEGEPTTPLGPPPGPIPMGYSFTPHQQSLQPTSAPAEPTTPLGPPPGPIPMGYHGISPSEDFLKPQQNPQEPTTPQGPPPGPIPMGFLPSQEGEPVPPPVPPQRNRAQTQPAPVSCEDQPSVSQQSQSKQDIARKPSAELAAAAEKTKRKDSECSDNRKDPLVNVIPIKIDQSRPESPRPPHQEPGLKPNMSQPSATKTEAPPPSANPKIAKLDKIKDDVEMLMEKIEKFDGSKTDKEYLYLDEMLTRHLISLDGIDPEGQLEIRQLRKESIKSVNRCLSLLDRKVSELTGGEADHNNQVLSELAEESDKKTS